MFPARYPRSPRLARHTTRSVAISNTATAPITRGVSKTGGAGANVVVVGAVVVGPMSETVVLDSETVIRNRCPINCVTAGKP